MLEAVNVKVDRSTIKPAEWQRLRAGIALKTFTALMKRYQHMTEAQEAQKLKEARRFAKGLFFNVLGQQDRAMADQAFAFFDKDNDASLTLKEMKDSVTAVFKERKNMAASLRDTDSIVKTLEFGIGCLTHFLFAAIYLVVWGLDIMKGFSTFSATVLALTFVFGNSVRQIYESMLFLFVEHAYDVGDLLEVEVVQYRVKKIDLMYTLFVKGNGERIYYPNTRLITLPVTNLTRTATKGDKVVFLVDIGSSGTAVKEALTECVKAHYEENESDFNVCPSVNYVNILDPFKVQIQVYWTYNFGADEGKRISSVKTSLLAALQTCLAGLEQLEYTLVKEKGGGTSSSSSRLGSGDGRNPVDAVFAGAPVPGGIDTGTTAAVVVGLTGIAASAL
eukprot:gene8975-9150_t